MVQTENSRAAQAPGLPTEFLADVRPASETSNTKKFQLTKAAIRQIFLENPEVHNFETFQP